MTDKKESRVDKEIRIQHENKTKFDNIINKSPYLKKLKDQSNGLKYKGDIQTDVPTQQYKDNYDQINWTKKLDKKPSYRLKINGKYVDEDQDD